MFNGRNAFVGFVIFQSFHQSFVGLSATFNMVVVISLLYVDLGWCSLGGLSIGCVLLIVSMALSAKFALMRYVVLDKRR